MALENKFRGNESAWMKSVLIIYRRPSFYKINFLLWIFHKINEAINEKYRNAQRNVTLPVSKLIGIVVNKIILLINRAMEKSAKISY